MSHGPCIAHVHAGAYAIVAGRDPRRILPPASWEEVEKELDHELALLRKSLDPYPVYSALNLCRLLYTWIERNPAVSKASAGTWAARSLPGAWAELASLASRLYRGKGSRRDLQLLKEQLPGFYAFARQQIGMAHADSGGTSMRRVSP